jgi:transcriptional regulator with XRE-family HTH domain
MTSLNAERLSSFHRQMADFARGELFRELRERRHLSQEDAAHELGVSVKTVRTWEKGGGVRWTNAQRAGEFYGVDPERLVSRDPDDETPDVIGVLSERPAQAEAQAEILERIAELAASLADLHLEVGTIRELLEAKPAARKRSA